MHFASTIHKAAHCQWLIDQLLCRGWQAYRSLDPDAVARWKEVASYISIESVLEGIPLVFQATLYLYQLTDLCHFVTCDSAAIARTFPADVLTLPSAPPISAAEVMAIHSHDPHCGHLPLTDDGWFTLRLDSMNATFVERNAGPFRRVAEIEIPGEHGSPLTSAANLASTDNK